MDSSFVLNEMKLIDMIGEDIKRPVRISYFENMIKCLEKLVEFPKVENLCLDILIN